MNPSAIERRFLGVVEVDSGTLIVGDPTYLLARRSTGAEGVDYAAVIEVDLAEIAAPVAGRPVLLVGGFGGDGTFPVYGDIDQGELTRVVIEFDEPEDAGL